MPRAILDESNIHPAIRDKIANHEQAIVREEKWPRLSEQHFPEF